MILKCIAVCRRKPTDLFPICIESRYDILHRCIVGALYIAVIQCRITVKSVFVIIGAHFSMPY